MDSKLSNHIILQNIDLENLQTKIEGSEWIWERWPVLKTIVLEHIDYLKSPEEAINLVKKINFEECLTLENVILPSTSTFDFTSSFQEDNSISRYLSSNVQVKKLNYNPKNCIKSFGLEQIFCLKMYLLEVPCTVAVYDALNLIGQRAKNLSNLTINISTIEQTDLQAFETGLQTMFCGLKNSLRTLTLNNKNQSFYGNAVLRALIKECPNLCNLNISILHSFDLKNCDIADICQQLKNLRKCYVRLTPRSMKAHNKCIEWKEALEKKCHGIVTIDVQRTHMPKRDLSDLAIKFSILNRQGLR